MSARPLLLLLLPLSAAAIYLTMRRSPAGGSTAIDQEDADLGAAMAALAGVPAAPSSSSSDYNVVIDLGGWDMIKRTVTQAADETIAAVRRVFNLPAAAAPYADAIANAERQYGIPDSLLGRVLYQESRFRDDIISGATRSPVGALGIAQFMPATARDLDIDPLDPAQAIDGAGRYLRRLYDALGDWGQALAAYNWGIGNVQRKGLDRAPAETRNYVAQILNDVEV